MMLTDSGNIDCGCNSGACGKGFFENEIRVGDYYVNTSDFAELVMYFFTNTDLETGDIRNVLLDRIKRLHMTDGYNPGNVRLSEYD
jgi:hypothetical protein